MGLKEPLELSNAVGVAGDCLIGQVAGAQMARPGSELGVGRSDVGTRSTMPKVPR
jgi:hypothetical protein